MKLLSDCSGECCICAYGNLCLAGHGDDDFSEASINQVKERLKTGRYRGYKDYMINWLRSKGCEIDENDIWQE